MGVGTGWAAQERTPGKSGPSADLCSATTIHREEPHRRQGRHFHKSRQCHTRNEKSHECDLESGHNVLRLRHKGESRKYLICLIDLSLKWIKRCVSAQIFFRQLRLPVLDEFKQFKNIFITNTSIYLSTKRQ